MLERPDFADDLADHKVTAGIEFGMPSLHRLDMFGMRPPGFQRFLRGEAKQADFLAVDGLVHLTDWKPGSWLTRSYMRSPRRPYSSMSAPSRSFRFPITITSPIIFFLP